MRHQLTEVDPPEMGNLSEVEGDGSGLVVEGVVGSVVERLIDPAVEWVVE